MCGGRCDVLRRRRHFRKTFLGSTLVEPPTPLLKHSLQSPSILQLQHLTSRGGTARRRLQTVFDCLAWRFPSPCFTKAQKAPVATTAEIFLSRLHSKENQPPVSLSYALAVPRLYWQTYSLTRLRVDRHFSVSMGRRARRQ